MKTIAPCLFILGLVLLSCRDKSADVQRQGEPSFSAYASNCIGSTLTRSDGSETDSIFVWSFTDRLIMDFSYRANCCLDSSDFSFTRALGPDSIVVTVVDTVDMGCRCPCLYMAYIEIADLPNDRYVVQVRCAAGSLLDPGDTIHTISVTRTR